MTFVWQRKMVGREIAKLPVRGDTPSTNMPQNA
jgi:hypothetical protein